MTRPAVIVLLAVALLGCAKEPMAADYPQKDPYAGLSGQAKVDAIRNDPQLMGGDKAAQIAKAQKEAGLPVTGQ